MSQFSGIEVLTYCVMENHFHLLVRVPARESWMAQFEGSDGEERLLAHLARFCSAGFMAELRWQLGEDRRLGDEAGAQARLEGFRKRFCNVSAMMKELKVRFSKWHNRRNGRRGALWMDRYKSVLIEGPRRDGGEGILDSLRVMSLHIDLNPIRAGLVEDPANYRWSGHGAAVGGVVKKAREGLTALVGARSWRQAAETYRMWLYVNAKPNEVRTEVHPKKVRHGVALSKRSSVLSNRGRMSVGELIWCRVRYFSDRAIIGRKAFVATQRDGGMPDREDSKKRRVNSISELERSSAIFTLRKLRVDAVGQPGDRT